MAGIGVAAGLGAGCWINKHGPSSRKPLLRPPGALPEDDLLAECIRCALCIEACPWDTLKLAGFEAGLGVGTPYLVARRMPCYLCEKYDELKCIEACPTNALSEVPDRKSVRMGVAVVDEKRCSAFIGSFCKACAEACPISGAIVLDDNRRPIVNEKVCVGCGICDHVCPTEPSSIIIRPASIGDQAPEQVS